MVRVVNPVKFCVVRTGAMTRLLLYATKSLFLIEIGKAEESETFLLLIIVPKETLNVVPATVKLLPLKGTVNDGMEAGKLP